MMCKGSNNFRNGDYATANFFFLRKKMPIFCVTLGLPLLSQEEILIAAALIGGRQRLAFFRYLCLFWEICCSPQPAHRLLAAI